MFFMLKKYSDFIINEGSIHSPSCVYWDRQLEELLKKDWLDISVKKQQNKYKISFRTGNDQYDYYSVLFENKGGKDRYLMEEPVKGDVVSKFIEKFKTEFFKNEEEYIKNLAYDPKCLGDLRYLRDSSKYNL